MTRVLSVLFALGSLALLPSCALRTPDTANAPEDESALIGQQPTKAERALTESQRSRLYYHILLADIADSRGEHAVAHQNFLHAARLSDRPELARRAAIAAERAADAKASLSAAQFWTELAPDDVDGQELLAIGYLRAGQSDKALDALRTVVDRVRAKNGKLLRELLRVIETETKATTLAVFERLAADDDDADISFAAAYLALRLKQWPAVERWAERSLKKQPNRLDPLKLKLHALQAQNRSDEAIAIIDNTLQKTPERQELVLLGGQLLARQGKTADAIARYQDFVKTHANAREVRFALAALLYDAKDYLGARPHFEAVAAAGEQTSVALYYLGDIAVRQKEVLRAIAYFRQVKGGRFHYEALSTIAQLLAESGDLPAARRQLAEAAGELPTRRLDFVITDIDLLRDAKRYREAKKLLDAELKQQPEHVQLLLAQAQLASAQNDHALTSRALTQALGNVENPALRKQLILAGSEVLRAAGQHKAALTLVNKGLEQDGEDLDLLYARALLAESMQQFAASEQDLRAILLRDPDNGTALNALGYALADRNTNLDEASALIAKALKLSPNDPAVIDSMGWLQYRLGNLPEALSHLRRAYALHPDPEIAAHLGEVLWRSGQKTEARRLWQDALKKNPGHTVLKRVIKRFKP